MSEEIGLRAAAQPDVSQAAPSLENARPLRALAARGAVWTFAGYGGGQVLRFGGNLILTRMLFGEAFGLMALVNVFLQGLQLFSDIGIGPSIIQHARGADRRFLDTAWTMQVVRGLALFALALVAAPALAAFYGEPALATILPVSACGVVLSGLWSTKLFTQSRELALGRLTAIELASQAAGFVAMVGWALVDRSVWALVAGGIAVALTKTVLSHLVLPGGANRLTWDAASAREVFRFGKWIFLSTVLTFLVGQSDRLVFGKLIPLELLGVYSIAVMVATMPTMALGHGALSLVFPIYSRVHNAGGDFVPIFRRVRQAMLVLGGWMLAGLVAGGPAIVALLYDPRYAEAGWIVRFLSMGAWFYVLETTNGAALLALGRADRVAASNGGKLVGMVVLIPVGFLWAGFPGAVLGFATSEVLKYAVSTWAARRAGLPGRMQDLVLTAAVAGSAAAGGFAAHAARMADHSALFQAVLVFVVVSVIWVPFGLDLLRRYRGGAPRGVVR